MDGVARIEFVGNKFRMGPLTTVQFGGKSLDFQGEIETGNPELLGLDLGNLVLSADGRVQLRRSGDQLNFAVVLGEATLTIGGEATTLGAGESLEFELGDGQLELIEEAPIDAGIPDAGPEVPDTNQPIVAAVSGRRVKQRPNADSPWEKLKAGEHELSPTAEIEIGRGSKVTLNRGSETATINGIASARLSEKGLVEVTKGNARAAASDTDVRLVVPGGSIVVRAREGGSEATLAVSGKGTSIVPQRGFLAVESNTGESETLHHGERMMLSKSGEIEIRDRAPKSAQLTLPTLNRVTVHDTSLPVAVRIDFSKHCPKGAIEIAQRGGFKRVRRLTIGTEGSGIVELPAGAHLYRVRCMEGGRLLNKEAHRGHIAVRRDSGARPLPRGAPKNTVDADGRRYTILYQNRLPALTFRWKKMPGPGKLVMRPKKGRERRYDVSEKTKSFPSGRIREGQYDLWFEAGGKKSKTTRLTIGFDNAASSGYISSPPARLAIKGDTARLAGAAVRGWHVSVSGQALRMDGQYRFDQRVPVSADGTISVRFSHPEHGVHYYIRGQRRRVATN
jgi:hypothetical protein